MHPLWKTVTATGAALVTGLLPAAAVELNTQIRAIGGLVAVEQEKESLSNLVIGLWGTLTIHPDGKASGDGIIRYEGVAPCAWTPPAPENGAPPYCRLKNLLDGTFTVTGEVSDEARTAHLLTGLSDMVARETTASADDIIDSAPQIIVLQLTMTQPPKETIEVWGLSGGGRETRETGVANGGLLVSGIFEDSIILSLEPTEAEALNRHEFSGTYPGDWPIKGAGAVFLPDLPLSKLPAETAYEVFVNGGVKPNDTKLGEDTLNLDVLNPWFGGLYDHR